MIDYCSTNVSSLLTVKEALDAINDSVCPLSGTESVPLKQALGRILAELIISPINIPGFRNSSMDGFAFSSNDIVNEKQFTLLLVGTSWAGQPYNEKVTKGNCVQIFTGAVLPEGTDSVVMQELVTELADTIQFPADTKALENIRYPGEDIPKGKNLLEANK
jgi:molybdopterin molybdotransferase